MTEERPSYFELRFQPNGRLISNVRRFASAFLVRLIDDDDAAAQISVATHELLANAVNYARDDETWLRVSVEDSAIGHSVTVTTHNRAGEKDIAVVKQIVSAIQEMDDPDAFYQECFRRAATRDDGSGLGLARVCAEADMRLSYSVDDESVLTLSAHVELGRASQ